MRVLLKYNFVSFWKQLRSIWGVQFLFILAGYLAGFFMKKEYSEIYSVLMNTIIFIFPLCAFMLGPGLSFGFFLSLKNEVIWMSSKKPVKILFASLITAFAYYIALFIIYRLFFILGCSFGSWGVTNIEALNLFSGKKIPVSYRFFWATSGVWKRLLILIKICAGNFGKTLFKIFLGAGIGLLESIILVISCGYNKKKYGEFKINFWFAFLLYIVEIVLVVLSIKLFMNLPSAGLVVIGSCLFVLILFLYIWVSSSFIEKFQNS